MVVSFTTGIAFAASGSISGGPSADGNYTLRADILQCLKKEDPLDKMLGIDTLDTHPACGNSKTRVLAHITIPLQQKRTRLWNNLKNVPVSRQTFGAVLEDGHFVFKKKNELDTPLKAGIYVEAHLGELSGNKASLSLLVKHYSIEGLEEEMLVQSSGAVYLNPRSHQTERTMIVNTLVTINEEDIWGGEGVYRAPAPASISRAYPEDARLWIAGVVGK